PVRTDSLGTVATGQSRWRYDDGLPLGALRGFERQKGAGGDALEGCIEQQQPLEDCQSKGLVALAQAAFAVGPELLSDVTVGDCGNHRDRHDRAPDEEQKQSAAEPAL